MNINHYHFNKITEGAIYLKKVYSAYDTNDTWPTDVC